MDNKQGKPKNARFWSIINDSPVKLTMRPGETMRHYSGGATDEGWSGEGHEWEYVEGDQDYPASVHETICHEGRDCDGGHSTVSEWSCEIEQLMSGQECKGFGLSKLEAMAWNGVRLPRWQEGSVSNWDQFAEAAGY